MRRCTRSRLALLGRSAPSGARRATGAGDGAPRRAARGRRSPHRLHPRRPPRCRPPRPRRRLRPRRRRRGAPAAPPPAGPRAAAVDQRLQLPVQERVLLLRVGGGRLELRERSRRLAICSPCETSRASSAAAASAARCSAARAFCAAAFLAAAKACMSCEWLSSSVRYLASAYPPPRAPPPPRSRAPRARRRAPRPARRARGSPRAPRRAPPPPPAAPRPAAPPPPPPPRARRPAPFRLGELRGELRARLRPEVGHQGGAWRWGVGWAWGTGMGVEAWISTRVRSRAHAGGRPAHGRRHTRRSLHGRGRTAHAARLSLLEYTPRAPPPWRAASRASP